MVARRGIKTTTSIKIYLIMGNIQNITIVDVVRGISRIAPVALIICALLSFIAIAIVSVNYYEGLFMPHLTTCGYGMAILIAVIQELIRFALLVSSMRDFSENKPINGWLGLFGSGMLVWHDMYLANSIALSWNVENAAAYTSIFYFLILSGLLLEIRLILTVGSMKNSKSTTTKK